MILAGVLYFWRQRRLEEREDELWDFLSQCQAVPGELRIETEDEAAQRVALRRIEVAKATAVLTAFHCADKPHSAERDPRFLV